MIHRLQAALPFYPLHLDPSPIVPEYLNARLRDYQFDMLAEVAAHMAAGRRRVLLQLPTGGGKTVIAESAIQSALRQQHDAMFLVHRDELLKQTSKTFRSSGLEHSFVARGREFDPDALMLLAGVQTLVRRLHIPLPPNLIVIDEAHHATAGSWRQILDAYPDAFVLGLTATPERLDGQGLDGLFDVMVLGPTAKWLIAEGYLCPYEFYAPPAAFDTQHEAMAAGFKAAATAAMVDKPKLVGDIVEHYLMHAPGEQGIGFGSSREHSRHIADEFNARGVKAMHVDGDSSERDRDYFDEAFRDGEIRIGCNVGLFGEGYDVPNISYLFDAAPSKSLVNVMQRWGRVLRPAPGKRRAIICDHAGNTWHHGLPDDERHWHLEGRAARLAAAGGSDATPIHQCMTCYRITPSVVKICPGCGTEFPSQARTLRQVRGTLVRLTAEEREAIEAEKRRERLRRKEEERDCVGFNDFVELHKSRGYDGDPQKWAKLKMKLRQSYRRR